jgi:hypothetical protein
LDYNLKPSGKEKQDMAALLAAKGGKTYTEEELETKDDSELAQELK